MKIICEKCGKVFSDVSECLQHEKECGKINKFICYKCGKITIWNDNDINAYTIEGQCHTIDLGHAEYGSFFDGIDLNFGVCDQCLYDWVNSFKLKNYFILDNNNTGNHYTIEDIEDE